MSLELTEIFLRKSGGILAFITLFVISLASGAAYLARHEELALAGEFGEGVAGILPPRPDFSRT